jgi:hypothetical protein
MAPTDLNAIRNGLVSQGRDFLMNRLYSGKGRLSTLEKAVKFLGTLSIDTQLDAQLCYSQTNYVLGS